MVTFGLESNFNTHAIRPKFSKISGKKIQMRTREKKPSIKKKMEILYEKVLGDSLLNQEKLTKTERVKLF